MYIVGLTTNKHEDDNKEIGTYTDENQIIDLVSNRSVRSIDWIKSIDLNGGITGKKLKLDVSNKLILE